MSHARQVTLLLHGVSYLLSGTLHVDGIAALHTLNGLVIRYQLPKRPHRVPRGRYLDDLRLFLSPLVILHFAKIRYWYEMNGFWPIGKENLSRNHLSCISESAGGSPLSSLKEKIWGSRDWMMERTRMHVNSMTSDWNASAAILSHKPVAIMKRPTRG